MTKPEKLYIIIYDQAGKAELAWFVCKCNLNSFLHFDSIHLFVATLSAPFVHTTIPIATYCAHTLAHASIALYKPSLDDIAFKVV